MPLNLFLAVVFDFVVVEIRLVTVILANQVNLTVLPEQGVEAWSSDFNVNLSDAIITIG